MKNLTYLGLLSVPFCLGQHVSAQTAEQAKSASQQKPNIIFILADDMGYGDVSAYNKDSHIQTRHIDQMAANGVMFTDAHSCSAVSTPTRYGIITGRYNWLFQPPKAVYSTATPCPIIPHHPQHHGIHAESKWIYHRLHRQMAFRLELGHETGT